MSRGNRGILTALGLVLLFALAIAWRTYPLIPTLERFHYDDPRNAHYRPGGSECEPTALAALRDAKVRLNRTQDCQKQAEEYRQRSDDLVQQTRAANAADAQARVAVQGLWTSWFQTTGGFLTLAAAVAAAVYARDAAKEGKRTADEAESARKSFIETERGHLEFQHPQATVKDGGIKINFVTKNVGTALAEVIAVAFAIPSDAVWPGALDECEPVLQVKIPKDQTDHCSIHLPGAMVLPFYVAGYVRYKTISLQDCRTHFFCKIDNKPQNIFTGFSLSSWSSPDVTGMPHDT